MVLNLWMIKIREKFYLDLEKSPFYKSGISCVVKQDRQHIKYHQMERKIFKENL